MEIVCAGCGAGVEEGSSFCPDCGTAVTAVRSCPSCGRVAKRGAFCASCGASLDATPAGRTSPVAERRITTVLFGDLVGFTSLSESRDAEDVRELLSAYFARSRQVVERYGGTVEKFIGDAVMAVWGVPIAHEDDAERAVRAGLELVSMVQALGQDVSIEGLGMRVGLVTGEAAVTLGASGEGMVAGDAVNTASRVQTAAPPGEVWVDDTTRGLTTAAITYEDAGEHLLKGKSVPMRLFAAKTIVGSIRGVGRVDGLEAPHTGRDREMRLVKELFHSVEDSGRPGLLVVEGEAGVGKTRLGWEFEKYIDGLRALVLWHRGRCLSYGEGVAFWGLAEAVRARLGLVEYDTGTLLDDRLTAWLEENVPDVEEQGWLGPRVATLIGAPSSSGTSFAREDLFAAWTAFFERVGDGNVVLLLLDDVQHADEGLLDFLEQLLTTARYPVFLLAFARTGLVERRPQLATNRRATFMHLEPLGHPAMSTLVDALVDGLPEPARALLVERAEGIPLYAVETVRALIDQDLVVPREGRYVVADPAHLDLTTVAAPISLQALVSARLDALSPDERRVVTDASVLGLTFTLDGLTTLAAADLPDLDAVLSSLVRKQILSLETDRFSAERGQYKFTQAVVRQVAYDTVSKRDRKARHLAVAAQIEQQPDESGDSALILAQHYLDAIDASASGDADRAVLLDRATVLLERAAARAQALGAPMEALRHLTRALDIAEDVATQAQLQESASNAARVAGRATDALEHGRAAITAYESIGDHVRAGRAAALTAQATYMLLEDNAGAIELAQPHWDRLAGRDDAAEARFLLAQALSACYSNTANNGEAQRYIEQAVRLAEDQEDPKALPMVWTQLGLGYLLGDAPATGRALLEVSAELARERHLPMQLTRSLHNLACDDLMRDPMAAVARGHEVAAAARQAGDAILARSGAVNLGLALWTAGQWAELRSLGDAEDWGLTHDAAEDISLSLMWTSMRWWLMRATGEAFDPAALPTAPGDNQNTRAWSEHAAGLRAETLGDLATAAHHFATSVQASAEAAGVWDDYIHFWPPAVRAWLALGRVDEADALLAPVLAVSPARRAPMLAGHLRHLRGLVLGARGGDPSDVESDLRAAVAIFEDRSARGLLVPAELDLGRWLRRLGREAEADQVLGTAMAHCEELGALGWLSADTTLAVRPVGHAERSSPSPV